MTRKEKVSMISRLANFKQRLYEEGKKRAMEIEEIKKDVKKSM